MNRLVPIRPWRSKENAKKQDLTLDSRLICLALLAVLFLYSPANAQKGPTPKEYVAYVGGTIVPPGKFEVEGRPIACGSRAAVLDKNLNDVTAAYPQFVIINPERFGKLSPTLKLWAFSVGCGFALHGPDQAGADCYATRRGKTESWLSPQGVDQICAWLGPSPGRPYNQVPGLQRCEKIRKCYDNG
jgi:hypothetical protein